MKNDIKKIIIKAGALLRKGYQNTQHYGVKERGHLLSEYDTIVNEYLVSEIGKRYPLDSIYSEESKEAIKKSGDRWIIDPIDGTTYFIFGEPFFSISIAHERNGEIVEAHVYSPVSGDYYFSDTKTGKSFLNGNEIHVSAVVQIHEALVAFGFSANIQLIKDYYATWGYLFETCKKGVAWICPSLSICNVARGRIEAFIDRGSSMEGQAAASFILKNAGGKMFNYDKSVYDYHAKGGIFTNGKLNI